MVIIYVSSTLLQKELRILISVTYNATKVVERVIDGTLRLMH